VVTMHLGRTRCRRRGHQRPGRAELDGERAAAAVGRRRGTRALISRGAIAVRALLAAGMPVASALAVAGSVGPLRVPGVSGDNHKRSHASMIGDNLGYLVANDVIREKRWHSLPAGAQADGADEDGRVHREQHLRAGRVRRGRRHREGQAGGAEDGRLSPADNAAAALIESVKVWADARYRVAHALHGRSDVRQEPSKRADSAVRRRPNPKGA